VYSPAKSDVIRVDEDTFRTGTNIVDSAAVASHVVRRDELPGSNELFFEWRKASIRASPTGLPDCSGRVTTIRGIFPGCCASADEQSAKSMALKANPVIFFFMSFSLSRSTCHSTLDTRPSSLLT
jgi:hypothetical protein